MIRDIRSYRSRNNKTLYSLRINRRRYDILEVSDGFYCYFTLSSLVRNKRYPTLLSRVTEHGNQHSFYYIRNKCMLKNLLTMGLRERSWIFIKGDE